MEADLLLESYLHQLHLHTCSSITERDRTLNQRPRHYLLALVEQEVQHANRKCISASPAARFPCSGLRFRLLGPGQPEQDVCPGSGPW